MHSKKWKRQSFMNATATTATRQPSSQSDRSWNNDHQYHRCRVTISRGTHASYTSLAGFFPQAAEPVNGSTSAKCRVIQKATPSSPVPITFSFNLQNSPYPRSPCPYYRDSGYFQHFECFGRIDECGGTWWVDNKKINSTWIGRRSLLCYDFPSEPSKSNRPNWSDPDFRFSPPDRNWSPPVSSWRATSGQATARTSAEKNPQTL